MTIQKVILLIDMDGTIHLFFVSIMEIPNHDRNIQPYFIHIRYLIRKRRVEFIKDTHKSCIFEK
jgi:hypothetical protein